MNAAGALIMWAVASAFASSEADPWHEVVVSPFVLPGGVADPAGRSGFLVNAEHGISAVDLRSGAVLWETSAACRPIVVRGERLYASIPGNDGEICVVALDINHKGRVVFRAATTGRSISDGCPTGNNSASRGKSRASRRQSGQP